MIRTRAGTPHKKRRKKEGKEEEKEEGKSEEEGEGERCESVGRRKKKEENVLLLLHPHSLAHKVVTLPTSQPPIGWLKALVEANAAWDGA